MRYWKSWRSDFAYIGGAAGGEVLLYTGPIGSGASAAAATNISK